VEEAVADDTGFADRIRRLRAREESVAKLAHRYEPEIGTEIRRRPQRRRPQLHRTFDSMDIRQAVLTSFLLRAAVGQYDLGQQD
jgi:hypothetical protein